MPLCARIINSSSTLDSYELHHGCWTRRTDLLVCCRFLHMLGLCLIYQVGHNQKDGEAMSSRHKFKFKRVSTIYSEINAPMITQALKQTPQSHTLGNRLSKKKKNVRNHQTLTRLRRSHQHSRWDAYQLCDTLQKSSNGSRRGALRNCLPTGVGPSVPADDLLLTPRELRGSRRDATSERACSNTWGKTPRSRTPRAVDKQQEGV